MLALRRMVLPFLVVVAALVGTSGPAAAAPAPPGQADLAVTIARSTPVYSLASAYGFTNYVMVTNTDRVASAPTFVDAYGLGVGVGPDFSVQPGGPSMRYSVPVLAPGQSIELLVQSNFVGNVFAPAAVAVVVNPASDPNAFNNFVFRGFFLNTVVF